MPTKKKAKKSRRVKQKLVLVNFKVPQEELDYMIKNCKRLSRGNLSAWIRESAIYYRPPRGKFGSRRMT